MEALTILGGYLNLTNEQKSYIKKFKNEKINPILKPRQIVGLISMILFVLSGLCIVFVSSFLPESKMYFIVILLVTAILMLIFHSPIPTKWQEVKILAKIESDKAIQEIIRASAQKQRAVIDKQLSILSEEDYRKDITHKIINSIVYS